VIHLVSPFIVAAKPRKIAVAENATVTFAGVQAMRLIVVVTEHCVDLLLRSMRDQRDQRDQSTVHWAAAFLIMASAIVEGLVNVEGNDRDSDDMDDESDDSDDEIKSAYSRWQKPAQAKPVKAALVADLLNALRTLESVELRKIAVTNIVARPTVFDPGKTIVPALTKLHPRQAQDPADDHAFLRLWMHAGAFLLERSERSPNVPMNWRQDVKPACNCEDCRALNVFAHDAKEQVGRFRVRQDRRQHLQDAIGQRDLDMTYVTDPKGSPQTLVCTKTRRTYQRQCKQYRADLHSFNKLLEALPRSPDACATLASKIAQAQDRAKGWSASKA
jgi:hypothetical protein